MEWRQVPGYPDYEVSDNGQVWSRLTDRMKTQGDSKGYKTVVLHHDIHAKVHRLVASAFLGVPTGPVVRHLDGNPSNNHVSNLAYGDQRMNYLDAVRHGTLPYSPPPKTHCPYGHEFTEENTYLPESGGRDCRACWQDANRKQLDKRKRMEMGEEPIVRACDRDGCERPHYARGLCRSHYRKVMAAEGHNA